MGYNSSKSSSFNASGTDIRPEVVPYLFGEIGGLFWGEDGAVWLPVTPRFDISTREPEREGGSEPGNIINFNCQTILYYFYPQPSTKIWDRDKKDIFSQMGEMPLTNF